MWGSFIVHVSFFYEEFYLENVKKVNTWEVF